MLRTGALNRTLPLPNFLSGEDILVLTASEWRDNAVSTMQISAALSEYNKVVFVETPGGRFPRWNEFGRLVRRIVRMLHGSQRNSKQGLDPRQTIIYSPIALPGTSKLARWLNKHILTAQIRRLQQKFAMPEPIVWQFSPLWLPAIQRIRKKAAVFHCVDGLHSYDNSLSFQEMYRASVRSADVVFTPGVLLERELGQLNANTHRIGHGSGRIHLEYAAPGPIPPELTGIPEPRAVFAGSLSNWVDFSLLEKVAEILPYINFVLVGYVHALAPRELVNRALARSNVHLLGYQNFDRLPPFYHHCQIGIIPYLMDHQHVLYGTPTKFMDYFAAGLPCVSTRFPASETMAALATIVDSPDEFAAAIQQEILTDNKHKRAERRMFAQDHSWDKQIERMCREIKKITIQRH